MAAEPRSPEQRAEENERCRDRQAAAGIVHVSVMVPVDRVPYLQALTLAQRRDAKLLLESDLPIADQILQIHTVCRTLRLKPPLEASESRMAAEQWLIAQEPRVEGRVPDVPKCPSRR
jgi:hypothetical protein